MRSGCAPPASLQSRSSLVLFAPFLRAAGACACDQSAAVHSCSSTVCIPVYTSTHTAVSQGRIYDILNLGRCACRGPQVPEVHWIVPGEAAARAALDGPTGFLSPARLAQYATKRNDPATQVCRYVMCVCGDLAVMVSACCALFSMVWALIRGTHESSSTPPSLVICCARACIT